METDQSEEKPRPQSTMSKIANFFTGSNSTTSKTLLKWKQSKEHEEWVNRAVDTLVKKLKRQPNGIRNITEVLKARTENSICVTIPRSVDGRLQVSNHKGHPHVIYCRVWRWPDLQNYHELKAVKNCQFPFNAKKADVCINPYHYNRVENQSILPPILVPRQSEYVPGYSKLPNQQLSPDAQHTAPEVQQTYSRDSNYANNGFGPVNGLNSLCSSGQTSPMSSVSNYSSGYHHPHSQLSTPQYSVGYPAQSPADWQDNNGYMQQQQEHEQHHQQHQQQQQQQQQAEMEQVHYVEPEYWANVAYYELNSRVGELFRCNVNSYSLVVDGFTHPSDKTSNRFCLGQLSNINRNSTIEQTRRYIGKGVHIFFESNELYLQCLSETPVFVHSLMANHLHNVGSNIVNKIEQNNHMKIFDTNEFASMLTQVVQSGFEASYALTRMCTVRVSFVKGWNGQYLRQDITACPCWFEIHLNGPLKWLDDVLCKMGSPLYGISSVS